MSRSKPIRQLTLGLCLAVSAFGMWLALSGRGTPVGSIGEGAALLYGAGIVVAIIAMAMTFSGARKAGGMTAAAVIFSAYLWSSIAGMIVLFYYLSEVAAREGESDEARAQSRDGA